MSSGAVIGRCYDSAASTAGRSRGTSNVGEAPARPIRRTALARIRDSARQGGLALVWLLAVALIALGAAGVVAGMETPGPNGVDRTGRTGHGDAIANASLDAIQGDLQTLSDKVDSLGEQARSILAAMASNETDTVDTATAQGTQLVSDIKARAERIRTALNQVPIVGTPAAAYELSQDTIDRHDAYLGGLKSTDQLDSAWARLVVSALAANRLSGLLADHDQAVVEAAAAGRTAEYPVALGHLDDADKAIADARKLRDQLKATVDVSTLDQWLDRSHAYDVALRALYVAVRRGATTEQIRQAVEKEQAAKNQLPPDTRSLVLIMADIGQGGINDAAADIDQAHSDLEEALARPVDAGP
jgi:hypothetical protein